MLVLEFEYSSTQYVVSAGNGILTVQQEGVDVPVSLTALPVDTIKKVYRDQNTRIHQPFVKIQTRDNNDVDIACHPSGPAPDYLLRELLLSVDYAVATKTAK